MGEKQFWNELKIEEVHVPRSAKVSHLPTRRGDGYDYGGEAVLMIGDRAFIIGDSILANEIAQRWNAGES